MPAQPDRFCHQCGQPLPRVGAITVKLDRHDSDKLRASAMRSPVPVAIQMETIDFPPPPQLPKVNDETMPDAGWLKKHLRKQTDNQRRSRLIFILVTATALLVWVLTHTYP